MCVNITTPKHKIWYKWHHTLVLINKIFLEIKKTYEKYIITSKRPLSFPNALIGFLISTKTSEKKVFFSKLVQYGLSDTTIHKESLVKTESLVRVIYLYGDNDILAFCNKDKMINIHFSVLVFPFVRFYKNTNKKKIPKEVYNTFIWEGISGRYNIKHLFAHCFIFVFVLITISGSKDQCHLHIVICIEGLSYEIFWITKIIIW